MRPRLPLSVSPFVTSLFCPLVAHLSVSLRLYAQRSSDPAIAHPPLGVARNCSLHRRIRLSSIFDRLLCRPQTRRLECKCRSSLAALVTHASCIFKYHGLHTMYLDAPHEAASPHRLNPRSADAAGNSIQHTRYTAGNARRGYRISQRALIFLDLRLDRVPIALTFQRFPESR